MSRFVSLGHKENFPGDQIVAVEVEGRNIALVKSGEDYYALNNSCPHVGAPLAGGWVAGQVLTCPFHGWQFDIRTGLSVVPEGTHVSCYPTKLENDEVYVDIGD